MTRMARISVVVPSYNQADFIARTLESVISQNYPALELIVIDGGSKDGSWDIIRSYDGWAAHTVSEPDRGQSHAINKGFARATGEFVTWLNSDDVLLPGALHDVAGILRKTPTAQWITGSCVWIDADDLVLQATTNPGWNRFGFKGRATSVGGPSSFIAKALIDRYGLLDEDLHYSMDTELWNRFATHGISYQNTGTYLWGLRLHPAAKMSGHNFSESAFADPQHPSHARRAAEQVSVRTRHGLPPQDTWAAYFADKAHRVVTASAFRSRVHTFQTRGMPLARAASLLNQRSGRS
jgi:glycosyltransferase involved in cell wall biosynthesis